MRLCYGTFANVIALCVDDMTHQSLGVSLEQCLDEQIPLDKGVFNPKKGYTDPATTNRRFKCARNLSSFTIKTADKMETIHIIDNFKKYIAPKVIEDKKPLAIIAVLGIIQEDDSLDHDRTARFTKCLGKYKYDVLRSQEIDFSDFMGSRRNCRKLCLQSAG